MTKTYKLKGMDCPSCASMLECDLEDAGIKAKCSYADSTLIVDDCDDKDKIEKFVKKSGCSMF